MSRCHICNDSRRADIEKELLLGTSVRKIADQFGHHYLRVQRHKTNCLPRAVKAQQHRAEAAKQLAENPPSRGGYHTHKAAPTPDAAPTKKAHAVVPDGAVPIAKEMGVKQLHKALEDAASLDKATAAAIEAPLAQAAGLSDTPKRGDLLLELDDELRQTTEFLRRGSALVDAVGEVNRYAAIGTARATVVTARAKLNRLGDNAAAIVHVGAQTEKEVLAEMREILGRVEEKSPSERKAFADSVLAPKLDS